MNKEELKDLYLILNKELDMFNAEFFYAVATFDEGDPYTLSEFINFLTSDNHAFENDMQPYRDRVFR